MGSSYSLPLGVPNPPAFGRAGFVHKIKPLQENLIYDDLYESLNTQSGTQWDGFRHVSEKLFRSSIVVYSKLYFISFYSLREDPTTRYSNIITSFHTFRQECSITECVYHP